MAKSERVFIFFTIDAIPGIALDIIEQKASAPSIPIAGSKVFKPQSDHSLSAFGCLQDLRSDAAYKLCWRHTFRPTMIAASWLMHLCFGNAEKEATDRNAAVQGALASLQEEKQGRNPKSIDAAAKKREKALNKERKDANKVPAATVAKRRRGQASAEPAQVCSQSGSHLTSAGRHSRCCCALVLRPLFVSHADGTVVLVSACIMLHASSAKWHPGQLFQHFSSRRRRHVLHRTDRAQNFAFAAMLPLQWVAAACDGAQLLSSALACMSDEHLWCDAVACHAGYCTRA